MLLQEFQDYMRLTFREGADRRAQETLLALIKENHLNEISDVVVLKETIENRRGRKDRLVNAFDEFVRHLQRRGHDVATSGVRGLSPVVLKIELLKYLHEPRKIQEIRDEFGIDERQIRRIREDFRNGFDLLGQPVQVGERRTRDNRYLTVTEDENFRSTVHPIVSLLNLSQVYQITILTLDALKSQKAMYDRYLTYANHVYSQLSDYARGIIDRANVNDHPLRADKPEGFLSEYDMFDSDPSSWFIYLLKKGAQADITFVADGAVGNARVIARGFEDDKFEFETENGESILIHPDDILAFANVVGYSSDQSDI